MSQLARCVRVSDAELTALLSGQQPTRLGFGPDEESANRPLVELDATWPGLHWLLTGSEWGGEPPLNFLLGGSPLPDHGFGLGPPCGFTSDQVREIAAALEPIPAETLAARYGAEEMDLGPDGDAGLPTHTERYRALRDLVLAVARNEAGLVVVNY